jgi:hypothetical protein
MIAFSGLDHDELSRQLTRMLDASVRSFDTIAQELRVGVIKKHPPLYQELKGEFADVIAKAQLMLGMECKLRGEIEQARAHWKKGLEYARDDMQGYLRSALDDQ